MREKDWNLHRVDLTDLEFDQISNPTHWGSGAIYRLHHAVSYSREYSCTDLCLNGLVGFINRCLLNWCCTQRVSGINHLDLQSQLWSSNSSESGETTSWSACLKIGSTRAAATSTSCSNLGYTSSIILIQEISKGLFKEIWVRLNTQSSFAFSLEDLTPLMIWLFLLTQFYKTRTTSWTLFQLMSSLITSVQIPILEGSVCVLII